MGSTTDLGYNSLAPSRMKLVRVMMDDVPAVPDEDPELRRGILESLKTYEQAQQGRPARATAPVGANTDYLLTSSVNVRRICLSSCVEVSCILALV